MEGKTQPLDNQLLLIHPRNWWETVLTVSKTTDGTTKPKCAKWLKRCYLETLTFVYPILVLVGETVCKVTPGS